ncbi:MAG: hypothetical protein HYZ39_26465 [Mycolicibacterium cosmeticum]|nr:hypothetical protein [Mycolicibacterium cosmeticum]
MRRRLLLWSAPVVVLIVLLMVKAVSVVVLGNSAERHFAEGNQEGLRTDVAGLGVLNVLEPANAPFADGALAVLGGRLDAADDRFSAALDGTDAAASCPVRVNLELVRETLGDRAAGIFDPDSAARQYRSALEAVREAPSGCFAGNADPDPGRRAVLDGAAARLEDKLRVLATLPPPPPPPPPAVAAPAPAPIVGTSPTEQEPARQLDPGAGDPVERLQQILRDARG